MVQKSTGEAPGSTVVNQNADDWFRTTLYSIGDAVITIDTQGKVLQMNHIAEQLTGWKESEAAGNNLSDVFRIVNKETRLPLEDPVDKVLGEGKIVGLANNALLISKGGDEIPITDSNAPILDSEGNILGAVLVFRDTTSRTQVEKALRESEEKFRALFEDSQDTIYISTPEGKFIDINPAGLALFGYSSKAEMLALNIAEHIYSDSRDREAFLDTLLRKGYVKDYQKVLKRKNGSKITVLETAKVIRDENNTPIAYHGIIRDITQKLLLEEQLRYAQQLESIGTLAGGIAHDFNNILGIIVGHASLIKLNEPSLKLSHNIEAIQKASQRGASLVQQLLTFARKTDVLFESVRMNDVILEVVQLLNETLPKMIELKIDLKKNMPSITADITQIHQILLNLCLNARDAMPKGGTLSITSSVVSGKKVPSTRSDSRAREYVMAKVTDTGIGIDEQTMKRIFDPFFTTKGPGKGTGLGLALVYSIVESYSGIIDVESEPGRGATFRVYLPVQQYEPDADDTPVSAIDAELNGTENILIIEDEELLLDSLKSILTKRGYNVIAARDGEEGVHMYSLHSRDLFGIGIDLVITDLGLPKLNGQDVYRKIKEMDKQAKIILASGFIDPGVRLELKKMGATDFIQKPYLPEKVLRTIRKVLKTPDHGK